MPGNPGIFDKSGITYGMFYFLIKFLLVVLVLILLIGLFRNWQMQYSPLATTFFKGTVPNPKLDGLYQGIFLGHNTSWKGKKLNAANSTGINIFDDGRGDRVEKYPFTTYIGRGLVDKNIDVLKIDYNVLGNPFWLRLIVDEMVQVAPGQYLGKMQLRLIPGLPITMLYFQLKK